MNWSALFGCVAELTQSEVVSNIHGLNNMAGSPAHFGMLSPHFELVAKILKVNRLNMYFVIDNS